MDPNYQDLIEYIGKYIEMNNQEIERLKEVFIPVTVQKNTFLERENKPTKYLYFIKDGYVRIYYTKDGEEITTQINCPSRFITSFQSFTTNTTAYDNVQTISTCQLFKITLQDLKKLNNQIRNWEQFVEQIYEKALIYNEERTRDLILLNAEERYLKLLKNHPEIIQNVPLQYIASYIGIKPESLSRIRRQIIF